MPRPLAASVRVLAGQGPGQLDPAGTVCQVGFVLPLHPLQVPGEGRLGHGWQDGDAILGTLTVADDDLVRSEVDVLDSQAGAFEQAQPGTIEEGAMSRGVPSSSKMTARTSSRVRTMGRRSGRLARTTTSSHGRS